MACIVPVAGASLGGMTSQYLSWTSLLLLGFELNDASEPTKHPPHGTCEAACSGQRGGKCQWLAPMLWLALRKVAYAAEAAVALLVLPSPQLREGPGGTTWKHGGNTLQSKLWSIGNGSQRIILPPRHPQTRDVIVSYHLSADVLQEQEIDGTYNQAMASFITGSFLLTLFHPSWDCTSQ